MDPLYGPIESVEFSADDSHERDVPFPSSNCKLIIYKSVSVFFWLAFGIYAFPLPQWSNFLNATFWNTPSERAPKGLCTMDPALFKCSDGQDFKMLAEAAGRPGCSCGEGILGEALCALMDGGISLSSLIGTTTGSGSLLFFSIIPTLNMWLYVRTLHYELKLKFGKADLWNMSVLLLVLFQLSFTLITVFPACVWDPIHTTFTVLSLICLGVHLLIVAIVSCKKLGQSRVVHVTLSMGIPAALAYVVLSSGGSALFQAYPTPFNSYLYFYGEVIGLFCAFGITPVLLVLGECDDFLLSIF